MRSINIKGFSGLSYVTLTNVPVKKTEFGEAISMHPNELERIVSIALIINKTPIHGAEFRLMKSAMGLSNEGIANELGLSRNTVLKWGKALEARLPMSYEMLFRLLVAESLGVKLKAIISDLKANDKVKQIKIKAAA